MRIKFTYKDKLFNVNVNVLLNSSRADIEQLINRHNIDLDQLSIIDIKVSNGTELRRLRNNTNLLELFNELVEVPVIRMERGSTRYITSAHVV